MNDLITARQLHEMLGHYSYRYLTEKLVYEPGFPKALRKGERGYRFWRKADVVKWMKKAIR